ncbi:2,3-butanediol dehydrogenase [Alkalihalobacillus sp. LMS6]|uniref:2,3-butanediol dehydrogenase n=1 Tax=Alkalihalobacillus sp. LMS6 TaxID=2924034 RepID=UPI0020D15928|nr:2,3-butanediol dehydrogenase [Alkalihalobacillus sp. LMS6]UTR06011.1 2,3-butanediol dehydrogenase [Alkalihalobacillus sp. LMS6]
MRAAVWHNAKDVRVEENWEVKEVTKTDVKIKVAWAGICGSDLHEYLHGPIVIPANGPDALTGDTAPIVMGHEFAGVIDEVGSDVSDFKKGDRVVVNPLYTHGVKPPTLDLYDGFAFAGLASDGGFADYCVIPESMVHKVPEGMTLEEGALVEPMAVTVQALKEADFKFGQTCTVFGAGPIGLCTIIAAKAAGASKIIVFDLSEERLKKATEVGATHVFNSGNVDPVEEVKKIEPEGVDASFEVAGVGVTLNQAIHTAKSRGTVVIVSIFTKGVEIKPMDLTVSGVKITSSLAYEPEVFQRTIDSIAAGALDVKGVITDHIELEAIVTDGFERLSEDKSQAKILVKLSGES